MIASDLDDIGGGDYLRHNISCYWLLSTAVGTWGLEVRMYISDLTLTTFASPLCGCSPGIDSFKLFGYPGNYGSSMKSLGFELKR